MDTLEDLMFQYLDRFKLLFFPEQWDQLILNCTKNEIFILLLIYRKGEVNMTQIADYINTPLNTATGIVSRMEKKNMIQRKRNDIDKRVVTVAMTEEGLAMMQNMMQQIIGCGQKVMVGLTAEETQLMFRVVDKIIQVLQQENQLMRENANKVKKVKRIEIE